MHHGSPNDCFTASSLTDSRPASKSLFRNILHVSPCGSRFWRDRAGSRRGNSFKINILVEGSGEKVRAHCTLRPHALSFAVSGQASPSDHVRVSASAPTDNLRALPRSICGLSPLALVPTDLLGPVRPVPKSLSQNILPVSLYSSIFCRGRATYEPRKSLEINILDRGAQKEMGKSIPTPES